MPGTAGHRGFGHIRKLPSKRWQASYIGPDTLRHNAPATFHAKDDAVAWLAAERKLVDSGRWTAPAARAADRRARLCSLSDYADAWLGQRPLQPRTRAHYRSLLDRL